MIVVSILAAVAGFLIDADSFATNLLAGIVSTALGVWVAVVIVDGILRSNREREWRNVQVFAVNATHQAVLSISTSFNDLLPDNSFLDSILKARDSQDTNGLDFLKDLVSAIKSLDPTPSKEKLVLLYEECSPELDRLRSIVLPTVTVIGNDPQLVSLLQQADKVAYEWSRTAIRQREYGVSSQCLLDCSLSTLSVLIALSDYVALVSFED
ncbi:MAG: hypothetical protein WA040_06885 [Anaerolineae bacterium]